MQRRKTREPGVYRLPDGRYYVIATIQVDGRRRRAEATVGGTLGDAVRRRLELKDELRAEPAPPPPPPSKTTLVDYAERWLSLRALDTSTAQHYVATLARRILPILGQIDVRELTRTDVLGWCRWAETQMQADGRPYADATLSSWWRVLSPILRDAAADYGVPDPTVRVTPPRSPRSGVRETRTLTVDQAHAILDALPDQWRPEIATYVYTGLRAGELRALLVADYCPKGLSVTKAVKHGGSVGETKTKRHRLVPVCEDLRRILDDHIASLARRGFIVTPALPLFPAADGGRRGQGSHYKVLRQAAQEAGIDFKVGPQTLRRTLNTRLLAAGAPAPFIRVVMGHVTTAMTDHYAGATAEDLASAFARGTAREGAGEC